MRNIAKSRQGQTGLGLLVLSAVWSVIQYYDLLSGFSETLRVNGATPVAEFLGSPLLVAAVVIAGFCLIAHSWWKQGNDDDGPSDRRYQIVVSKRALISLRGRMHDPSVYLTDVSQIGVQRHLLRSLIDFGPGSFEEFHRGHRDGRFVYFDTEYHPGTVIELSEKKRPQRPHISAHCRRCGRLGRPRPDPHDLADRCQQG